MMRREPQIYRWTCQFRCWRHHPGIQNTLKLCSFSLNSTKLCCEPWCNIKTGSKFSLWEYIVISLSVEQRQIDGWITELQLTDFTDMVMQPNNKKMQKFFIVLLKHNGWDIFMILIYITISTVLLSVIW